MLSEQEAPLPQRDCTTAPSVEILSTDTQLYEKYHIWKACSRAWPWRWLKVIRIASLWYSIHHISGL